MFRSARYFVRNVGRDGTIACGAGGSGEIGLGSGGPKDL